MLPRTYHHYYKHIILNIGQVVASSATDDAPPPRAAVFLGGYCRFAAVTAEAFAASRRSWRRSLPLRGGHCGGLFYTDTKTTQKIASCDFRLLYHRSLLGVCASSRHLRRHSEERRRSGNGTFLKRLLKFRRARPSARAHARTSRDRQSAALVVLYRKWQKKPKKR